MPKCDCGAKYTSFKNYHHEKCRALTSVNESTLDLYATLKFKQSESDRIDIIDKETQKRVGSFSYNFSRGEIRLDNFNVDIHGDSMRSGLMRCIDWFLESVNDDRIDEFRGMVSKERNKWKENNLWT